MLLSLPARATLALHQPQVRVSPRLSPLRPRGSDGGREERKRAVWGRARTLDRPCKCKFSHTPRFVPFLPSPSPQFPLEPPTPIFGGHEPWHRRPLAPELDRRSCRVFDDFPARAFAHPRRWASSRIGTARWPRAPWAGGSDSTVRVTYVSLSLSASSPTPHAAVASRSHPRGEAGLLSKAGHI